LIFNYFSSPLSSPLLEERGTDITVLSFSCRRRSLEDEVHSEIV